MTQKTKKIKIILADDHILLRDTLASYINNFEDFEVIGQANNGEDLIWQLRSGNKPDVVVLDLNMPKMNGYETAKYLHEHFPSINILVLTMYDSEIALIRLLQVGVKGFLKKDIQPFEMKKALLLLANSQYYYGNKTLDKLTDLVKKGSEDETVFRNTILSEIEIEFLRLSCTDMTYKEIATDMNMTPRKIDHFRDNLFNKLEVKSRVGLAIYAIKNGITAF